jgi:hypothetical protein
VVYVPVGHKRRKREDGFITTAGRTRSTAGTTPQWMARRVRRRRRHGRSRREINSRDHVMVDGKAREEVMPPQLLEARGDAHDGESVVGATARDREQARGRQACWMGR